MTHQEPPPLLDVRNLEKVYHLNDGLLQRVMREPPRVLRAVDHVSFSVQPGETLGLIGESGCGKSTLARTVLRLHEPTSGRIVFDGKDITRIPLAEMTALRRRMQIIFQDPYASLNPRKSVEQIVGLPLALHGVAKRGELRDRVVAMLENVGLKSGHLGRYPHQFSGGQRQRIGIARALILNPSFVVCDEPVSALDVSVQAQIIALLGTLKRELGLTYLFISHDIGVIGHVSDRVAVMYLGDIVEIGPTRALLNAPSHPYTKALLSAVPQIDAGSRRERVKLTGDLPSPLSPPSGCKFHTRCPFAMDVCRREAPVLRKNGRDALAACHLLEIEHAA
ncbi:ABC transporter ATP-binding protein [Chelatococcus asaccharovorans]|uniref:ABC transporter ATP-binding protein n=1 Tax=Chelatococcus asaccharovorans TaxID=28210 RepID=UPI00224C698A|nr:dipeptide ABC transporter ATP-binding protein [Chelatococcus asaccharovorans]CAH1672723.1 dipeptide ABC transporter ATP binding subunit DppF [Chelatococcus asaccharovorans]CAH1675868.1 dipeptide ABC transporter ATP binding subunit DppF [Chelatococcus asaccharovorans]